MQRNSALKSEIRQRGVAAESFNGGLLFEPGTILNKSGKPFAVFSPFWRACLTKAVSAPAPDPPRKLRAPESWVNSLQVSELGVQPPIDWAGGLRDAWQPGEKGAHAQLNRFRQEALDSYGEARDHPGVTPTSRLSPHLRFGEISPRQVWHAIDGLTGSAYLRQLGWREFSHHLLYTHPQSVDQPVRPEFARFPSKPDSQAFSAWTRGKTGYPFVDAGMRELWRTGWMHNRVRMVAASFLVKHLLIAWQEGAAWFWDTLVDADLANNTMGWQCVAGCGADATPYFRIFNPVLQGEKFDPTGNYVRRWIPELARLPDAWIHKPWRAPRSILSNAGVELGKTYPYPIVEHDEARRRALGALRNLKCNVVAQPAHLVKPM
jgi:deoxyribodipyrimidine photo-lyase